jgi:uncharacterized protein
MDTNVLVSGFLKPRSHPARILRLILQGDVEILINEEILTEYLEVLNRPKFRLNPEDVHEILRFFRSKGMAAPSMAGRPSLPDPDDEAFLEAALSGDADFLITGNRKHFPVHCCRGQKVVTPTDFLSLQRE